MNRLVSVVGIALVSAGCGRIGFQLAQSQGSVSNTDSDAGSQSPPPSSTVSSGVPVTGATVSLGTDGCTSDGTPCATGSWRSLPDQGGFKRIELVGPVKAAQVTIKTGTWVTAAPFDGTAGGGVEIDASGGNIHLEIGARIDVSALGYGGGGGGGGNPYGDSNYCPFDGVKNVSPGGATGGAVDGEPGAAPGPGITTTASQQQSYCVRPGGKGGGRGGSSGTPATDRSVVGIGGNGGGSFGGKGGAVPQWMPCDPTNGYNPQLPGTNGAAGGYLSAGANGESSPDSNDDVFLGSGGGGGSGGWSSTGYGCGGGKGGNAGVASPSASLTFQSGGGGAGGGAGGGSIRLLADSITVDGDLIANGAGDASLNAGYGAGGGIVLRATTSIVIGTNATLTSIGGNGAGKGVVTNGGTVKLRARSFTPSNPRTRVRSGATSIVTLP